MTWFRRKTDPRLFVELLFQASSMYANHPSTHLELGDYGEVSKKTGEFIRSGNILQEYPELQGRLGEGKETPEEGKHLFACRSEGTARGIDVNAQIPDIFECSVKFGWEIEKDRHAVLVMIDPVLKEFRYEGRLRPFILSHPEFIDKAFVTKVYRCSTFARLLTNGRRGQIYVGFSAGVPLPVPVLVEVGAGIEQAWKVYSQIGDWSTGKYKPGEIQYAPLAKLRQVRPEVPTDGWRGPMPPPITDPDTQGMMDYFPPWGELNEKGRDVDDEEEVEDEEDEGP